MSDPIAKTPKPLYYAVIFTSRTGSDTKGYPEMAARMEEIASEPPGYLGIESVRDAEGNGITVSSWTTEESIREWKANSEYFRLISYPALAFGFIGAITAIQNYFVAGWVRQMTKKNSPQKNFCIIAAIVLTAFIGITFFFPYVGVVFTWMLFAGMMMTGFCTSFYLNQIAEQSIRATLLSFKGLALNMGYGLPGIFYALLVQSLRQNPALDADPNLLFRSAALWFPVWFGLAMLVVVLVGKRLKNSGIAETDGDHST